jgi:hypothetical protein
MSLGVGSVGEFAVTEGFAPAAGAGVGISGMAWFVAAAPLPQKQKLVQQAPAFVPAPSAFSSFGWLARSPEPAARPIRVAPPQPSFIAQQFIQSFGWFPRTEDVRLKRQVAPVGQPTFLTPQQVLFTAGWFLQPQDIRPRAQPRFEQPTFVKPVEQIVAGGWAHQENPSPARRALPDTQQPAFVAAGTFVLPSGWMQIPADWVRPRTLRFEGRPAFVSFVISSPLHLTDTDVLQLPVDCVLAGQQPYDFSGRDPVITAKYSESQSTPRSRVKRLGGSKPSSSTKSGPLGGSHKE